ncbi:DNA repair exonuclease [Candidatus Woesearchaeota archaeon]|nr:DNA repair exonuclease [Candidatus Woesearchaeota archaeon]HIH26324.1 DNA repair exonuclease [Nanoarchaeota archaeon]
MKFAHFSDCHIGGWREDSLRDINLKSFELAVDICINEHIGFVIIAGDLFDTALPSIDILKSTAKILNKLKDFDIPIYIIPGSHDFSASGKTMLDVLENTGLVHNVMKFNNNKLEFTTDRTGVKLAGMFGRKGGLETYDYANLDKENLETESGFKIFLFHTLLEELKNYSFENIESESISILPKGFNYYAGGHPHFVYSRYHENYGVMAYPGPLYPNNFQELEKLKHGGFFIVDVENNNITSNHIPLNVVDVISYFINAENMTPKDVENDILSKVIDFDNKIVTIRIEGCLKSGKVSDINFKYINESLSKAYHVLKNTSKLVTKDFQEIKADNRNIDDIEISIVKDHQDQSFIEESKIMNIMKCLDKEKFDGEKNSDFESRIIKEVSSIIEL